MIRPRINLPPAAHILIDEFMPAYDVSEYHETRVRAPIEKVYHALRTADLGGSPIIRLLLRLRALPAILTTTNHKRDLKLNLDAILKGGFVLLGEHAPNEIALGLVGRFWTLSGTRCRVTADEFNSFDAPDTPRLCGISLWWKRARKAPGWRLRRGCGVWMTRAGGAFGCTGP